MFVSIFFYLLEKFSCKWRPRHTGAILNVRFSWALRALKRTIPPVTLAFLYIRAPSKEGHSHELIAMYFIVELSLFAQLRFIEEGNSRQYTFKPRNICNYAVQRITTDIELYVQCFFRTDYIFCDNRKRII